VGQLGVWFRGRVAGGCTHREQLEWLAGEVMSGASAPRENGDDIQVGGCNNWPVSLDPTIRLRSATPEDAAFIVEMARHACVIEDWPLPDADSEGVQSVLPPSGEVPIVAVDAAGFSIGAVWTFHNDPRCGSTLPEFPCRNCASA
jgi:hypothetical protein